MSVYISINIIQFLPRDKDSMQRIVPNKASFIILLIFVVSFGMQSWVFPWSFLSLLGVSLGARVLRCLGVAPSCFPQDAVLVSIGLGRSQFRRGGL